MAWRGSLALDYRRRDDRTVVHDRHDGPLRVLKSLHPEAGVCHSVLVHPPGGIVGGDTLAIAVTLASDAHALVTTPGATRFYRSAGATAEQSLSVAAAAGSRLEWLPLETIAYSGCEAENRMRFELAPGAEMIGWDVTALGLPASEQPFVAGRFTQTIELPGSLARARQRACATTVACSTRRSAGPASACWRRSGSAPAAPSPSRVARRCSKRPAPRPRPIRCARPRARPRRTRASSCCAFWRRPGRAGDGAAEARLAGLAAARLAAAGDAAARLVDLTRRGATPSARTV